MPGNISHTLCSMMDWRFKKKVIPYNTDLRLPVDKKLQADKAYFNAARNRARKFRKALNLNDPVADDAWQFLNDGSNPASPAAGLDINVAPVYLAGYSGSGVKLIIIDDALDSEHDDIKPNIDLSLTDDIVDAERTGPRGTDGKMPEKDNHGTRCASLAGAVANNSKCAYGIAHNVTIGGIRLVHGTVTSIMTAEAIVRFAHLAQVISSSWGPTDSGKLMIPVNSHVDRALRYAVTMGNHGLGAAVFFPAGNGGMQFDHCGADSYVNHPATIAVTSVGHIGLPPYYTEKCPAISVTVPSGGYADSEPDFVVKGTDMSALPVAAINNECREDFYGTSAAVPIAAGAVALAYEANPNLSFRDIRALLALSGRIPRSDADDWFVNSGGFLVSDRYGSGLLDVTRLVKLSSKWTTVGPLCIASKQRNNAKKLSRDKKKPMRILLSNCQKSDQIYAGQTTKFKFNIPEAKGRFETRNGRKGHCFVDSLEIVTVHMQWVHTNRGHLRVTLVSPGGMIVDLLGPRKLDHFSGSSEISWKSLMNFGEAGSGEWHVLITDTKISTKKHDQTGCVWYIRLELHGTESGKDCFSKNREIILPMWTQLQENARNLTKSHKLNAEEIADIYNRQRWNALKMELPQKDTR
uniref:PC3-like endoprotease variant B n=1 Tax=Schistocephalus solidus TaxID=70667 RepID=A0A0X3PSA4_SCHSO